MASDGQIDWLNDEELMTISNDEDDEDNISFGENLNENIIEVEIFEEIEDDGYLADNEQDDDDNDDDNDEEKLEHFSASCKKDHINPQGMGLNKRKINKNKI